MNFKSLPIATSLTSCALLATFAGLPLNASAAVDGARARPAFYIGGGIGYDRVNSEDFTDGDDDLEDERVTYKGLAGFRLDKIVSLEGQYIDFGTAEGGNNNVKADGFTAGVVVNAPIFKYVHPYGKIGALFWDADGNFNNVSSSDDGIDLTYGVGARFAVTDHIDLRAEYERFELNDTNVDNVSALLQFNFF